MSTAELSARAAVKIHATPSDVYNAFVDGSAMSRFWFTRRDNGLQEGKTFRWFLGGGADAVSFDVYVKELLFPNRLVIDWPGENGRLRQVTWLIEELEAGGTSLAIEETGFVGSFDQIIEEVLNSTRGFNQVVVAAKAFVEHGVRVNVVADHV